MFSILHALGMCALVAALVGSGGTFLALQGKRDAKLVEVADAHMRSPLRLFAKHNSQVSRRLKSSPLADSVAVRRRWTVQCSSR